MNKKFNIEVEMDEQWIPVFMSMLEKMEELGQFGASRWVSFYSDGDGSFRPKFKADVSYEKIEQDDLQYDL